MKTTSIILSVFLAAALIFSSCNKKDDENPNDKNILPTSFKVDIPESISHANSKKDLRAEVDTIPGDSIYEMMALFIYIGESASQVVQDLMTAIAVYHINQPMSLSFQGDEDGRTKNLVVVENASFENANWEFRLDISDAPSAGNADGGKGIQLFWNTDPIKGVAFLKPYNINRNSTNATDIIYRIDYSEAGEYGYEAHMIVAIAGLPAVDPQVDPFALNGLKMFAGKNGDIVDVYGNSSHPNAHFYTNAVGFNWAFVASGNETLNIGVAEVGLPPGTCTATDRTTLLDTYSLRAVFTQEIHEAIPGIDSATVEAYLANTQAPGYFDTDGFAQAGTAPVAHSSEYGVLLNNIQPLAPYKPSDITSMTIEFAN